jgi:hypothetical protein
MKRFRLSTLMLLIVIAALSVALVVQQRRAARREAELQARLAQSWPLFLKKQQLEDEMKVYEMNIAISQKILNKRKSEAAALRQQLEEMPVGGRRSGAMGEGVSQ